MTVDSRLTEIEEALRLLRDAKWLQGRRMSGEKPSDLNFIGFNADKGIWEPKAGVLDADLDRVDVANTGDETTLYSFTIPADTLGATGGFKLVMAGDLLVNDGAGKTLRLRVKLGGTTILSSDAKDFSDSANRYKWVLEVRCMNSATDAQKWGLTFIAAASSSTWPMLSLGDAKGLIAAAYNSSSKDTTTDLVLDVTADWSVADANDSIRKEMAILERIGLSAGTGAGSGGASDHGDLTGLGDTSDHTYASLIDGSRAFTGEQTFEQGVVIEDVDGTPVGNILLTVINEILRIRNSGDSAYKNVELAELILGAPTTAGILLKAAAGILFVQKGDDSALGTISASAIAANEIDTQSGNDRLLLGGSTAKRLRIPVSINDPATVEDGDVWYDLVTAKFRAREDGASTDIIHAEYLDSDAITAVPFIQYIPFGSEPITGQSYSP